MLVHENSHPKWYVYIVIFCKKVTVTNFLMGNKLARPTYSFFCLSSVTKSIFLQVTRVKNVYKEGLDRFPRHLPEGRLPRETHPVYMFFFVTNKASITEISPRLISFLIFMLMARIRKM